jgi:uncharacterized protein with HEPN domain
MSHREPAKYLFDMLSSCDFLITFTADKMLEQYKQDRGFRSAVERELQIIGEALMQLNRHHPDIAARVPDYLNLIGFRHVLVHGYDQLNPVTVWNAIETKLVSLKRVLETMLAEY